jgi:hypothetical protein
MKIALAPLSVIVLLAACGGGGGNANYPPRHAGCAVKRVAGEPTLPVDQLGTVQVDCGGEPGGPCERKLLDEVCARGGDVAWGLGDNALTATTIVAHAAHSRRADTTAQKSGCPVQVFDGAPPMKTENVGPVEAFCDADDSKDVCMRELEDQVCQLGGDVLWQVEGPTLSGDRQRLRGRAAHTR